MTTYVVAGASSLLGRLLIGELLARPECTAVYALCPGRALTELRTRWAAEERVSPVTVELTEPGLGTRELPEKPDHVVQLSSVGTGNVLDYARTSAAARTHLLITPGKEAPEPGECSAPSVCVYRTSVLAGDSRTGETATGTPLFSLLSRLARLGRLPVIGPELGRTNLVPVDYVAAAMAHLMHKPGEPGTYDLAAPQPYGTRAVYNEFADAAGAPHIAAKTPRAVDRAVAMLTHPAVDALDRVPTARATRRAVAGELGLTPETLSTLRSPILRPNAAAEHGLADSGLAVPHPHEYAGVLYRYWRRELDPGRARRGRPRGDLAGSRVLITGASSGIGRLTALRVAELGGVPVLVARRSEELARLAEEITSAGGRATIHPCDLTDGEALDTLIKQVLDEHGHVDVLVNNAGRSIRRSVFEAADRLHDYERTMAVNYFAAVRLTLGLLPAMRERGRGHVVNITTQGIQNHTPRFSAYLSSKAALEEFGLVAGRETLSAGITFSSVKLPLVSTEMTAPSEAFDAFPGIPFMGAERARDLVLKAIVERPESVGSLLPAGRPAELASMVAPRTVRALTHLFAHEAAPEHSGPPSRDNPVGLPAIAAAATRLLRHKP